MKHDWKKEEKLTYIPKSIPTLITIPAYPYLTIKGSGAPSSEGFQKAVESLFSISYGLKFAPRKGLIIEDYEEYSVYPLEGFWDISEEAKQKGSWDKNDFIYTLMIRQPSFINLSHLRELRAKIKKEELLWDQVMFEKKEDGLCLQMLHTGPFDDEPESFAKMDAYLSEHGYERRFKAHKEIYLSDFTKTKPEALKTTLRLFIKKR
jgi:hypothetical protein